MSYEYELARGHYADLLREAEQARLLAEAKRQKAPLESLDRRAARRLSEALLRLSNRLAGYRRAPSSAPIRW
jgi:hypothetical protein